MKLQIQSYNEKNPDLQINHTWELLERTRILKIWDVLSILIANSAELIKIIIAEEFKCNWENKSLIIWKNLKIIHWKRILKEINWPKTYIIKEIKEKKYKENLTYSNKDMFDIYNFEYINDLVIESNNLLGFLENNKINEDNINNIYLKIRADFSNIIKILNNIWCFENISRQMLSFLFFFDNKHNWFTIEDKKLKIDISTMFLRDFWNILHNFENELYNWINLNENISHINWENDVDILIQKYIHLIEWSLKQTNYSINLLLHPEECNNQECDEIEFF